MSEKPKAKDVESNAVEKVRMVIMKSVGLRAVVLKDGESEQGYRLMGHRIVNVPKAYAGSLSNRMAESTDLQSDLQKILRSE